MSDLPLIEPTKIKLESKVREGTKKEFQLGYYPATEGVRLLGLFAEVIDIAARKKSKDVNGLFGENLKSVAIEICKYVEVKLSNGNWQRLENETLINAHVPDYEMLLQLTREVHDYNSFFFNSGRLLNMSLGLMDRVKAQAMKMFRGLSESSSPKAKRASKSSGRSTASKTR